MGKGHILVDLKRIEDIEKNGGGGGGASTDTKDETVTLSLDKWVSGSNNTYSQTVAVDGMTATSNPVVLLSGAADDPTDDEEESYACISSITTADDSITFVVDKMPKVSFNVIIKNVVNAEGGNDDVAELEERVDVLETEVGNKVDTTDSRLSDARTPLEHNHDDKYYTESEIDSKFNTTNQNVTNNANAITQLNSDIAKFDFINVQKVSFTSDVNNGDIGLTYVLSENDWVLVTFELSTNKIALSVTHDAGGTWQNIFAK